jgi:hypothetical protein
VKRNDSVCGACGRGASPTEEAHHRVLGYEIGPGDRGCGTRWRYVSSDYSGMISDTATTIQGRVALPAVVFGEPQRSVGWILDTVLAYLAFELLNKADLPPTAPEVKTVQRARNRARAEAALLALQ